MSLEILKTVGGIAGLAGLSIGMCVILLREIIRRNIFPGLSKDDAFRIIRLIVIVVWTVAIFGIAAWTYVTVAKEPTRPSPQMVTSPTSDTRKDPALAASDIQIEQRIRARLAKSKIGQDDFKVTVQNGVATWDGETNVAQHKGVATRMARDAGATNVVNNIKVKKP